jgi:hypothetical protein
MAPIQEPWVRECRLKGLNIPGYILFCGGGIDRPTGRILERNINMLMLPGCSSRDLVAASIRARVLEREEFRSANSDNGGNELCCMNF